MKGMNIIWKSLLTLALGLMLNCLFAQPGPPEGGHGSDNNQEGGGAPIGSGLGILFCLGIGWSCKKVYTQFMADRNESAKPEILK